MARVSAENAQKLAASCAEAIVQVHGELQEDMRVTKRATTHSLHQMHAATATSLAEVYKATKASCNMAKYTEQTAMASNHLAVDSAAALLELHECC